MVRSLAVIAFLSTLSYGNSRFLKRSSPGCTSCTNTCPEGEFLADCQTCDCLPCMQAHCICPGGIARPFEMVPGCKDSGCNCLMEEQKAVPCPPCGCEFGEVFEAGARGSDGCPICTEGKCVHLPPKCPEVDCMCLPGQEVVWKKDGDCDTCECEQLQCPEPYCLCDHGQHPVIIKHEGTCNTCECEFCPMAGCNCLGGDHAEVFELVAGCPDSGCRCVPVEQEKVEQEHMPAMCAPCNCPKKKIFEPAAWSEHGCPICDAGSCRKRTAEEKAADKEAKKAARRLAKIAKQQAKAQAKIAKQQAKAQEE